MVRVNCTGACSRGGFIKRCCGDLRTHTRSPLLTDHRVLIIISDVQTKPLRLDIAVSPDKQCTKDWLGKQVEDTVEDSFRVG